MNPSTPGFPLSVCDIPASDPKVKNPVLKMDTNPAEIWLLLSKSFFEKEKTMSFYNPLKLYNADFWKWLCQ